MTYICSPDECYVFAFDALRQARMMIAEAYHTGPGCRSARADELLTAVDYLLEAHRWRAAGRKGRKRGGP